MTTHVIPRVGITAHGPKIKSVGEAVGPPLLAYAIVTFFFWGTAILAQLQVFRATTWSHWDSGLYLTIANRGYFLVQCVPATPGPPHCGDTAFFPGYPALLAPLVGLGLPQTATGVIVSWLFDFGTLVVLWCGFLRRIDTPMKYVGLTLAACVPGDVYMRALYPMAITEFFVLLALLMLTKRRWLLGGIFGGLAAACYPTAAVLTPFAFLWVVLQEDTPTVRRTLNALKASAPIALAVLIVFLVQAAYTGRFDAFFLGTQNYHTGLHFPWVNLWPYMKRLFGGFIGWYSSEAMDMLAGTLLLLALVADTAFRKYKGTITSSELLIVLFLVAAWMSVYTQANVSYWRTDTLLLPSAIVIPRMKPWLAVAVTAMAVAVVPVLAFNVMNGIVI